MRRLAILALLASSLALTSAPRARAEGSGIETLTPPSPPPPASALPVVPPAPDLAPFVGKRVARVDVEIEGESWGNTSLPRPTAIKAGDVLSIAAVRAGLEELTRTARFARATASGTLEAAGVRVVYRVVARKVIETLRVDLGGAKVEQGELLREADLAEGGELVGAELYAQQERMETFLARRGYPDATVAIEARSTDDPLRVVVMLEVTPGDARIIEERAFYVVSGKDRELRAASASYRVKTKDRADETALDAADAELEGKLHALGYYGAKVSHDVVRYRGRVTLRVRLDAGPRILPRYEGNDSFDEDALTEALELDKETDLAAGHLVDKLREFYLKHGFYDVEIGVEERGGAKDPVHHRVFKIVEHRRVTVTSRAYPCLSTSEIARLKKRVRVLFLGPLLDDDTVSSPTAIGREIDSFLEEELPGADLFKSPDPRSVDDLLAPSERDVAHPAPIDLDPVATYVPATYERALEHLQQLFRNEGYLHAQVGPVQVVRRRCDPKSPPGRCIPLPLPKKPTNACAYDPSGLPLPVQPLDPALSCVPDPSRGVTCESNVALRLPIKLGPRVTLYDLRLRGAHYLTEEKLANEAGIDLGRPVSTRDIDDARRRVQDAYKEEGFAYADVNVTLDESPDHTRARATLDVQEGEQVIVKSIVIQGNDLTSEKVIRRRVALQEGRPYRLSDVRKTQERIATLGVFSSVTVGLSDPYVPQRDKTVVITVTEVEPKYVEVRPGFSTGEGFRIANEFGDRNLFASAIGFSTRLQLSFLPSEFIIDPEVRKTWDAELGKSISIERVAGRATARMDFPEIGLGPLMRMSIEGVGSQTPRRDFRLRKVAGIPTFVYRPYRDLLLSLSQTIEYNEALIFHQQTIQQYLENGSTNLDVARLLRVPDGKSQAFAQRLVVTWDRRDSSFNPRHGAFFVSGVEHVDWFSLNKNDAAGTATEGHTLRFTETFAGYVPVGRRLTFAAEIRLGWNAQLTNPKGLATYPDRLFFLGGFESMRAWYQDTFIPQESMDKIRADARNPNLADADRLKPEKLPIRGGNLMINPKAELRIPLGGSWETVAFADIGNLWGDPSTPFDSGRFPIRAAVGSGIRYQTPIGPAALDYGINVTRYRPEEDFGAVQFSIGIF